MLSAVGELGGTRAWLRFFANHPNALASRDEIGALQAKRRLAELRSGKVEAVPCEAVFERAWERFKQ